MKLLDLFSGIGGFSLGAEAHGIETIGFVEKDPFCQRVLKKHWPDVPIESDIRNVKGENYGATDIISGGFPCQPFSVAGKRKGTDDDRYLWDETIRVVAEVKPRWFIGENVEGLINIQDGMVLRQVQDDLEKEGFQVQCLVIPASGIGAWHQRKRVWIIAHSNSNRESRRSQYVQEGSRELGKSHVCDSQHNGSSTTKEQGGNTQTPTGSQKRENSSLQSERTSRPTDNGNVSNTNDSRDRTSEHGTERQGNKTDDQGRQGQSQSKPSRHSQDVSNTIGELSDGCSSTTRHSESELKGMVSDEAKNWNKVWSKTERCGEQATSRGNVSDTDHSRFQDWAGQCKGQSTSSQERESSSSRHDPISNTDGEGLQGHRVQTNMEVEERQVSSIGSSQEQYTWWQTESSIRGVPNGISYGLDKGRVNRIKSLGNSIVPQIAYQIFKSIIVAEEEK